MMVKCDIHGEVEFIGKGDFIGDSPDQAVTVYCPKCVAEPNVEPEAQEFMTCDNCGLSFLVDTDIANEMRLWQEADGITCDVCSGADEFVKEHIGEPLSVSITLDLEANELEMLEAYINPQHQTHFDEHKDAFEQMMSKIYAKVYVNLYGKQKGKRNE